MVNAFSIINGVAVMALFHCVDATTSAVVSYSMNQTCSPPTSRGGKGYCGPSFCDNITNTLPGCIFKTSIVWDYPSLVSKLQTKTCVQSTDPRCSSAALKALMVGPGVKAAYCNDAFLVIQTDTSSGFPNYLDSIRNPPASTSSDGTSCVTRYINQDFMAVKIPLFPTLLSTSDPLVNNVNLDAFPNGGGNGDAAYMSTSVPGTGATMGLPTRGAVGITVGGQIIFPAFNNMGYLAPQKCEVDTCNEHVGGGGGEPHLHGDPFGDWCLYSARNYTSAVSHPPQIGWALDGYTIYGRHLSSQNLGFSIALDDCGGHIHGTLAYHYHAQVISSVTNGGVAPHMPQGVAYYASTTGPYKCFKGDISKIPNYWGKLAKSHTGGSPDNTTNACTGSTNYYTGSGITMPAAATNSASTSRTPSPSAAVTKTTPPPTVKVTPIPTAQATPISTVKMTPVPTVIMTPVPTVIMTPVPTVIITPVPTVKTTPVPTVIMTPVPTVKMTPIPTVIMTPVPTVIMTPIPTVKMTPVPTVKMTPVPTVKMTPIPTVTVNRTKPSAVTPNPTATVTANAIKTTPTPTAVSPFRITPTSTPSPSVSGKVATLSPTPTQQGYNMTKLTTHPTVTATATRTATATKTGTAYVY